MLSGVRPSISLASLPTARTRLRPLTDVIATTDGSLRTISAALHEHQRVRGTEIDRQIGGQQTKKTRKTCALAFAPASRTPCRRRKDRRGGQALSALGAVFSRFTSSLFSAFT